jgi:hypothetical protein
MRGGRGTHPPSPTAAAGVAAAAAPRVLRWPAAGIVRYHTYEVLQKEIDNPAIRWAYLPYSMHMAGPREAIQHMIIRKNYGVCLGGSLSCREAGGDCGGAAAAAGRGEGPTLLLCSRPAQRQASQHLQAPGC